MKKLRKKIERALGGPAGHLFKCDRCDPCSPCLFLVGEDDNEVPERCIGDASPGAEWTRVE